MATATTEIPLPQSITGSRVVVVGGSSGTGAAAVRLLAGSGAHVLVMGRSGTRPDGADAGPGTVRTAVADMLDEGALRAALEGEVVFLVVRDQDVSREWYRDVVRAKVTRTRDPVILRLGGATLILNEGGGPTPDKPDVVLAPPEDPRRVTAFLNLRVDDIAAVHAVTTARGGRWSTPPIDRGSEVRGYLRDPDGHLVEVGQAIERQDRPENFMPAMHVTRLDPRSSEPS